MYIVYHEYLFVQTILAHFVYMTPYTQVKASGGSPEVSYVNRIALGIIIKK